jgi:hypothetical protein
MSSQSLWFLEPCQVWKAHHRLIARVFALRCRRLVCWLLADGGSKASHHEGPSRGASQADYECTFLTSGFPLCQLFRLTRLPAGA